MFQYNSVTWVPRTTAEHAQDILADLNNLLRANGVNKTLTAVIKNVLWIFILAVAGIRSVFDLLLYNAQSSLDPTLCSDEQILNLLQIAGTTLIDGTYTTVWCAVTASADGNCVIPAGTRINMTNDVYFTTNEEVTIPAGFTGDVQVTANVKGPVTVVTNQFTEFATTINNFASMVNDPSVPGRAVETIAEARQRLIRGKTIENNLDGLIRALKALQGVTDAKVYFNTSTVDDLTLPGGDIVSPRHIRIYIHGASDEIANTYAQYSLHPTEDATEHVQYYQTESGQYIEVFFDNVETQDVYIQVNVKQDDNLTAAEKQAIEDAVLAIPVEIGQVITSNLISQYLTEAALGERVFKAIRSVGVCFFEDLPNYSDIANVDSNRIASIVEANIDVNEVT